MADVDSATRLSELLKHPEDLEKLSALKAEFTRKKAAVDGQLRHGLKEQLELTQSGMNSITEGQRTVNLIKEEMMKIDKLCAEAQNMIQDFPHINLVAQTHRNFEAVEKMRNDIQTFEARLEQLETLLAEDDEDPINQERLLQIHYGLTQLRDVRDDAMAQIKSTEDGSTELIDNLTLENGITVQDLFTRLDDVVEWFDKHIGETCINLIDLVQSGNDGLVVRLAIIVEEEEKTDKKVKALQDAQREYKDLASRFRSINSGPKELRGYKDKFIKSIEYVCQAQMDEAREKFNEDPEKIDKYFKWYFNHLNVVKLGMVDLMPKKWKILQTYTNIYHKAMHDFLVSFADDETLPPQYVLAVINWVDKYYAKMAKLGFAEDDLQPHVIDNRSQELIRTYRSVIVKAVDQYMDRINEQDRKSFLNQDREAYEINADGIFQTRSLGDVWTLFSQNLSVAASSDRNDVAEGVVDSMFRTLMSRQRIWSQLIDEEKDKYTGLNPTLDGETVAVFQEWLIALANDQIICIDDEDDVNGRASFVTVFEREVVPLVSQQFALDRLPAQVDELKNGYIDISSKCIQIFCQLIFLTDFKPILSKFFTPEWYSRTDMASIIATFRDYLNDYLDQVHRSLRDLVIDSLADELLIQYLSAVRNKSVKFRRTDQFAAKMKDDLITAFDFFREFGPQGAEILQRWRAVEYFLKLLESDKTQVPFAYEEFKYNYKDVHISWVEAVLRARDDFERGMLNAVKQKAAETVGDEAPDDPIMGRVR
ncbi:exocyst complex component Sec6 [Parastagonospora nodorum]|nr:exocyst complex component Sec6 [Parastagonospora nodorum]KAH4043754.1 exocyst complex component Sec6 [Parastagonospora nodorum]KAH4095217.1 exocyst complex component Sec6 [Parastagonospora nodorum]KAH4910167.1 exocyst complex component Sec6 [Parastagonospora nodorum]KAH4925080.1 exocyst complex component Sec6 [Parastagonospora nodorum]